jgi:hypothetical protein
MRTCTTPSFSTTTLFEYASFCAEAEALRPTLTVSTPFVPVNPAPTPAL